MNVETRTYKGVILDMDGVITRTAVLHARAWKQMFDDFLEGRSDEGGQPQQPFDIVKDYRSYVDGKPRVEGLRSFLESRNIAVPVGGPDDPAEAETMHGLGRLKNDIFRDLVDTEGVEIFPESVLLVGRARVAGLGSALLTSSKNGPFIMDKSGLMPLFNAMVDGNVAAELSLKGKPEPDIVVEAAHRLGAEPGVTMLFEDAAAGVQAGHAAGARLVVGVVRDDNEQQLMDAGADVVVHGLGEVRPLARRPHRAIDLASVRESWEVFRAMVRNAPRTIVFLDYDGTLTPIVDRPGLAKLDGEKQGVLRRLADLYKVAVVSGRGLEDIRSLVGLEGIIYAGGHGLEVAGPNDISVSAEQGAEYERLVDKLEKELSPMAERHQGVIVERKRFSVAVHFRLASEEGVDAVNEAVQRSLSEHEGLRKLEGKKVLELRPDIDWDKGRAVEWLLERLEVNTAEDLVIYVGDDRTDEDAFKALRGNGFSMLVRGSDPDLSSDEGGPGDEETYADVALEDTDEVYAFLKMLCDDEDPI